MAKAMVKCKWCGELFDRNSEPCVKVNARRYGHKTCIPSDEIDDYEDVIVEVKEKKKKKKEVQIDEDLVDLENYVMKIFHKEYVPPRIRKQINQYHTEYNYSYSGIKKSMQYWFEVKGNPTDTYGETLGIIPFIYEDAKRYFYTLYMAQLANESVTRTQTNIKVVTYEIQEPQQRKRQIRLFTFEEDEE